MTIKTTCRTAVCLLMAALAVSGCAEAPSGSEGSPRGASAGETPSLGAALAPTEVANAVPDEPMERRDAFRLVDQSTFGARLVDIDAAAAAGPNAWIDAQMQAPVTWMLPAMTGNDRWNAHVNVWWRHAITAEDQLRQRVAFALSEIFVVSTADGLGKHQDAIANYYDILLKHAFGNYRTLLEAVTLNPVMGEYLSMKGNRKPDPARNIRPDENFARELLQLFGVGLQMLNPDGTPQLGPDGMPLPSYDQSVVEGFAHVFTGWHYANAEDFVWPRNRDYINPMTAWPEFHADGGKLLLGGVEVPSGQSPEQDLAMALDNVFHHPNVGPFLVRQLIQRLVTSNPTPGYVRDVAAVFDRNATGERGSLGSVVKAILMHEEAREGHLSMPDTFGKVREPLLRMTRLWRAFEPQAIHREFNYAWAENQLAQAPLTSPTVFNFFRPDFSQPGPVSDAGLVSPEFEILDETSMITLTSALAGSALWRHNYRDSTSRESITIDISREMALEPDPEALLDHLDLLLLGGRMTPGLRDETRALMAARNHEQAAPLRVAEAIFLIITSPEAAIQR